MLKEKVEQVLCAVVFITQLIGISSFDYQHPELWSETYKECGGQKQSPVDIVTSELKKELETNLIMSGDEIKPTEVAVKNTGQTVEFTLTYASEIPSISGGPLNDVYVLDSIHFHWSKTSTERTEHTIDGKHFSAEMHLVHYKQSYGSLEEAKKNPDGVSVIGVFFHSSDNEEENTNTAVLEPIINGISKVTKIGQTATIEPFLISIFKLKKSHTYKYITYQGSLTTPPCSEVVTWLLPLDPINITTKQLEAFREIEFTNSDTANTRPSQQLNGRELQIVWNSKI